LIVGAMKAGSTALAHYLDEHPQVFCVTDRELHFFDDYHGEFGRGVRWYERQFRAAGPGHAAIGEKTVAYMSMPDAPGRIARVLPRVRLIFLLRHPVERTFSQYTHQVRTGYERLSFEQALQREPQRIRTDHGFRHFGYVRRSCYDEQIERFDRLFDRGQMRFVLSEELHERRIETLARVLAFLGVDAEFRSPHWQQERHVGQAVRPRIPLLARPGRMRELAKRVLPAAARRWVRRFSQLPAPTTMQPAMRQRLLERFAPHNRRLAEMLGMDLSHWEQ
jgi:hypothetical protein